MCRGLNTIGPWKPRASGLEPLISFGSGPQGAVACNECWIGTTLRLAGAIRERYEIRADRLLEMHDRGRVYMWPILVANEPWAEFDDFEAAFRKAIEIFHRRRSSAPVTIDW